MKDARGIGKARNARVNQTARHTRALLTLIEQNQGSTYAEPITYADFWEEGRGLVALISQCFHEANAYNNAMVPTGENFERDFFEVKDR